LDQIENLVINSTKIPLTNRTLVDEDQLIDLLDTLRKNLPVHVRQAEEIVAQADSLIDEAKRRSETFVANAEEQVNRMVAETEIVQRAMMEAERIRMATDDEVAQQQSQADRYAEDVLEDLEAKISRVLTTIQNGRHQLNAIS
jgi:vacuolar-type H+-ATPase subunit H